MNLATPARTLRDLGGAAWFGGALMGATGLNAAADAAGAAGADRDAVVSAGWVRWTPVFRAAALAHLAGSAGTLAAERSRAAALALGLSTSAAGAVAGTAVLGAKKGTDRAVHALEWVIPALLAAAAVTNARR
jgi:hypothetical protein